MRVSIEIETRQTSDFDSPPQEGLRVTGYLGDILIYAGIGLGVGVVVGVVLCVIM